MKFCFYSEKYHAQMKEAQQVVTEKTSSLEAEAYKTKRLQVGLQDTSSAYLLSGSSVKC